MGLFRGGIHMPFGLPGIPFFFFFFWACLLMCSRKTSRQSYEVGVASSFSRKGD